MRFVLLLGLAAVLALILALSEQPARGEDLGPKPRNREQNSVVFMTGPGLGTENLLSVGYFRRIKPDLSLGASAIFSDRNGYKGFTLGFGYHFGDPQW